MTMIAYHDVSPGYRIVGTRMEKLAWTMKSMIGLDVL
jgi:hypothetical protein